MTAWISQQMAAFDGWAAGNESLIAYLLGLVGGFVVGWLAGARGGKHE